MKLKIDKPFYTTDFFFKRQVFSKFQQIIYTDQFDYFWGGFVKEEKKEKEGIMISIQIVRQKHLQGSFVVLVLLLWGVVSTINHSLSSASAMNTLSLLLLRG